MSLPARQTIGADDLIIEKIEFIPIVMPLPKIFKGSNYFMSHRCTIITRVYTHCGIVGECYNGDEFEGQKAVLETLHKLSPVIIGLSAMEVERCWEAMLGPTYNILGDRNAAI